MADDEAHAVPEVGSFDPSKKKKKKPKERAAADVAEVAEKVEDLSVSDAGGEPLDFGKKKKKKKPQADGEPAEGEKDGEAEEEAAGGDEDAAALELKLKKKKKKPKQRTDEEVKEAEDRAAAGEAEEEAVEEEAEEEEEAVEEEAEGIVLGAPTRLPWEGTDRDYTYEELLGRVFNILRENNPELAGDRRRTIMRPPQVLREGTKKTVFVNFMDLCKTMHRQPEHVMAFLLAELGTDGSLDGQQRLIVKGRFAPKNFEGILRRYVNEYVMCNGCKSPDTILTKENRLFFQRCEQCGSHRSVAPIKAGFVARVGRRKATG
eukprot:TRINITY_DN7099_c0_g1_i1.p1 TRINITY_DN7099_c0_g1~~TRINITY_DN7099_c0_g1_i1.p1  ORF type:complete len:354 (+),score=50.52 TRINITY_DN7099_c0_g1_i1:106-1062(+)